MMILRRRRRWRSPEEALRGPRELLVWLWPLMRRLDFPDPDPHWQRTAQVNWQCDNGMSPRFWRRFLCLYLGHDMHERKVRELVRWGDLDEYTHRLDCERCGWEGPWTK